MDLRQLEAFASTARLKSFSAAAKELYLSQPTVSAHIHSLEKELHTRLINRTTKGFELTRSGHRLYAYAQRILELREKAVSELSAEKSGVLRIGASSVPGSALLPRLLAEFHKQVPSLRFQMYISDSMDVLRRVSAGSLELGIVGTRTKAQNCVFAPLCQDELVLITPNTEYYRQLFDRGASIRELLREPFILREDSSGTRSETAHFLSTLGITEAELNISATINSNSALVRSVAEGLGVSVISRLAVPYCADLGGLLVHPLGENAAFRSFYLVYADQQLLTDAARSFLAFAAQKKFIEYPRRDNGPEASAGGPTGAGTDPHIPRGD